MVDCLRASSSFAFSSPHLVQVKGSVFDRLRDHVGSDHAHATGRQSLLDAPLDYQGVLKRPRVQTIRPPTANSAPTEVKTAMNMDAIFRAGRELKANAEVSSVKSRLGEYESKKLFTPLVSTCEPRKSS